MPRPDRVTHYLALANVVAHRATCDRARVGVVLVNAHNHVVSMGYNGAPPNAAHCDEVGHRVVEQHCRRAVHAEMNALMHLECAPGEVTEAYCTHLPCWPCLQALYTAGVRVVYYQQLYSNRHVTAWAHDLLPSLLLVKVHPDDTPL
jgi:dCMP deaminase